MHDVSFLCFPGKGSMMIHCISGWDRTPMLTCLLRLSLWAVSVIILEKIYIPYDK